MKANPSAYTGERILSQNSKKGFIGHPLLDKIEKLRDIDSRRACLLAGSRPESCLRFLEPPFACLDNLRTSIRNRDYELR
jgi:lipid A disaccharide synthetase